MKMSAWELLGLITVVSYSLGSSWFIFLRGKEKDWLYLSDKKTVDMGSYVVLSRNKDLSQN